MPVMAATMYTRNAKPATLAAALRVINLSIRDLAWKVPGRGRSGTLAGLLMESTMSRTTVLCALASILGSAAPVVTGQPAPTTAPAPGRTEVLVLGTYHMANPGH